jgi:hypothetical protein
MVSQHARVAVSQTAVDERTAQGRGALIQPGDAGYADDCYEEARPVYDGRIDRHPALVVRCAYVADVSSAGRCMRPALMHSAPPQPTPSAPQDGTPVSSAWAATICTSGASYEASGG